MANEIAAFSQAAKNGTLTYTPETARAAAAAYDTTIEMLQEQRRQLSQLTELSGFGGFPSAKLLQAGFQEKIARGLVYLDMYLETYYRMQEAFLRAGKLYDEAEAKNKLAVQTAAYSDKNDKPLLQKAEQNLQAAQKAVQSQA